MHEDISYDIAGGNVRTNPSAGRPAMFELVADMSHAFPASSRGGCGPVRSSVGGCGEVSATDQGLESQAADW